MHIATQRIKVNVLEGSIDPVVPILARPSGGLADPHPIGRLVTGALESVLLHEGLQQVKAMAVAPLPVGIDPGGDLRKNRAGQMPDPDPRQDQKTAVVGDELQALSALLGGPPDPPVSGGALPGSGSKAD